MTTIARRLSALERVEWERVCALPPREILARGYVRNVRLPQPERDEMDALFARMFDDAGYVAREQLTEDERRRALELIAQWQCAIEP